MKFLARLSIPASMWVILCVVIFAWTNAKADLVHIFLAIGPLLAIAAAASILWAFAG